MSEQAVREFFEAWERLESAYTEATELMTRAVAGEFGTLPAEAWDRFHDFLHRVTPTHEEGS